MLVLLFLLGVLSWTLTEYLLHRFVGHRRGSRADFAAEHLRHHRQEGYFTPTAKKVRGALRVLLPAVLGAGLVLGAGPGLALTAGFGLAYLAYELLHRAIHVHAPRSAWGRWARRHHLHHHHVDPRRNHGVTSPLWDRVFGTWTDSSRVRLVAARAPAWLLDDQGRVRLAWRREFKLVGRTRGASVG